MGSGRFRSERSGVLGVGECDVVKVSSRKRGGGKPADEDFQVRIGIAADSLLARRAEFGQDRHTLGHEIVLFI